MKALTLIHFAELFLKGKNRDWFIDKLARNVKRICGGKVIKKRAYLLLLKGKVENLKYVPGISWWAEKTFLVEKNLEEIRKTCKEILKKTKPNAFKLEINRADKTFPYSSYEIAKRIGQSLENELKIKVDFENPEIKIFIDIQQEETLVYFQKTKGLGGLPVSTSGKGMLILSGGIDSPVAGFLMQKRGMHISAVHFHVFTSVEKLKETKIFELGKILARYQGKLDLFAVPHYLFESATLEIGKENLVLFRRFMLKIAEKIAEKEGAKALITGDSLGQVASQTIENLQSVDSAVNMLVLRPLIGLDKEEIISVAKKIGTYEPSIKPYKDCCSIITRKAKTKTRAENLEEIEKRINIEKVIDETLKLVGKIEFRFEKGEETIKID